MLDGEGGLHTAAEADLQNGPGGRPLHDGQKVRRGHGGIGAREVFQHRIESVTVAVIGVGGDVVSRFPANIAGGIGGAWIASGSKAGAPVQAVAVPCVGGVLRAGSGSPLREASRASDRSTGRWL